MLDTPLMKRMGVTPARLVLVGVLAVVLLVVIVIQWPASSPTLPTTDVSDVKASSDEPAVQEAFTESRDTPVSIPLRSEVNWPVLSLEEVVRYDPFQLPIHLRPVHHGEAKPSNPQDPQILQTLSQAESGMILMVGKEHVARVGAATLRPGDKIGSYRVSKIDATGIWLVDEDQVPK